MPLFKRVFFLLILFLFGGATTTYAACEVTSTTQYLLPNTNYNLVVNFRNTGDTAISYIKVPFSYSSVANIVSAAIQEAGWTKEEGADAFIFSAGSLSPGSSLNFDISITPGDERPIALTWNASTDISGDPSESCSDLSFTVTSTIPTPTPAPSISNSSISVNNNSATISWTTDQSATGNLNYGTTASYGSSLTTSQGTTHSVSLTGLSSSTIYHYQIQVTGEGGTTSSTDATFTTSSENITTVTNTTTVTTTTTVTVTVTPTPAPKDITPPTVSLSTDFSKPFEKSPTITGKSIDTGAINIGVASIDYSLDGGKNWLPVDFIDNKAKKSTTFEFTPAHLEDGNYQIKVRAKDLSGNTGQSRNYLMVIDRLPPMIGGSLFSFGSLILKPDVDGNIYTLAGVDIKVTLSAVGGPTSINLLYDNQEKLLTKNSESGLWSNIINLKQPGKFKILAKSIDGAQNTTEKSLSQLTVLQPGRVLNSNQKSISKSIVKVFSYEKTQGKFVLWNAAPYLETNPQTTDDQGQYLLVLPAGKYFIEVDAPGMRQLHTEIFEIDTTTPINQNFLLENSTFLNFFWSKTVPFNLPKKQLEDQTPTLIGQTIPDFDLSTSDFKFSSTSIIGRPTVLSFFSSWEPQTSDQLYALAQFKQDNEGVNVIAVAAQESVSKIAVFKKIGNYNVPLVADPDGLFVIPLSLKSLPSHLFLNNKGIIKEVKIGFMDKENLLNSVLK